MKNKIILLTSLALLVSCAKGSIDNSSSDYSSEEEMIDIPDIVIEDDPFEMRNLNSEDQILSYEGSYAFEDNSVTVNNSSSHNDFAYSDIEVGDDEDIQIKASFALKKGSVHLAISNEKLSKNSGWFALVYNASAYTVRLSAENTGSMGADAQLHSYKLSREERESESVDLTYIAYANGRFEAFLGEKLILKSYDSLYKGGYFGLCSWESEGSVSNIQYSTRVSKFQTFEINEPTPYESNSYRSGYTWGNWTFGEDISASNAGTGDQFSMSSIYQAKDQNLVFEADIAHSGTSAALAFGVTKVNLPTERGWYGFCFNRADKNVRCFAVNKGTIGTSTAATKLLDSSEINEPQHLKVEARANGFLSLYLNDELISHLYDPEYNGGYIGFNSFFSNPTFSNIQIKLTDNISNGIKNLNVTGIPFAYDENKAGYEETITDGNKEVTLKLELDEDYICSINGQKTKNYKFTTESGDNMVEIITKKKGYRKTSYVNVLIKSLYQEEYRPQVHYTPSQGWINDPNGLVYDEYTETYHLFAQYSKGVENNGIFGWIHATSKNLIDWEEKDIPILSNAKGAAWSGGAVIDYKNTSGLFNDSVPEGSRMVCFVTYQSSNPKVGIVYSLDHGETWIEHDKFVINNENNKYTAEFRDPKVIWYENEDLPNGGKWLLLIGGFTSIKMFSSDNLLDWKYESEALDVNGKTIISECPDILKLPLDGNKNDIKYVVSTGGTSYIVGNLTIEDGTIVFKGEQNKQAMFSGPNLWTNRGELYATQSFFNDKYDRTILLSWIVDRTASIIEGKTWNGAQSLPLESKLVTRNGMMMLDVYPVEELNSHRGELLGEADDMALNEDNYLEIVNTNNSKFDLEIEVDMSNAQNFSIVLADGGEDYVSPVITYDKSSGVLSYIPSVSDSVNGYTVAKTVGLVNNVLKLRIVVDAYIVDIYANDGEANLHGMMFAPQEANTLYMETNAGESIIKKCRMYALTPMAR